MLAGRAEGADAVDAVDRRIGVLRVFKDLLPVNAAQIRSQIEIILRKQDADRLDRAAHYLGAPEPLIVQLQHLPLLHGLPQLPQAAQDGLPMVRLDIMELFIADHLLARRVCSPPVRSSRPACPESAAFHPAAWSGFQAGSCTRPKSRCCSGPPALHASAGSRPPRGPRSRPAAAFHWRGMSAELGE